MISDELRRIRDAITTAEESERKARAEVEELRAALGALAGCLKGTPRMSGEITGVGICDREHIGPALRRALGLLFDKGRP